MQPNRVWSDRNSTENDPLVSGDSATSAVRHGVGSAWLLFRTDWSVVLWRVYQKMNENRLLAVAAGAHVAGQVIRVELLGRLENPL